MRKIWDRYKRYGDLKLLYIALRLKLELGDRSRWKLTLEYYLTRGRFPDFRRPSDFSEYVFAGMLYRRNDAYAQLADKVRVRDWVEAKGLGAILTLSYGVWDRAADIDFDGLPGRFVLKTNNGCKSNIVCMDAASLDRDDARTKLDRWLGEQHNPRETHYSLIEPKILAEEFIDDGTGGLPLDYKFMCFRGRPFAVLVCTERDPVTFHPKLYLFDAEWNPLPHYMTEHHDDYAKVKKPRNLDRMLEYASVLSAGFPFVRVDLYDTGSRIFFGELTFTPAAGGMHYFTDEALRDMYAALAE